MKDWHIYFVIGNIITVIAVSSYFAKKHYKEGFVRGCEAAAYDLTKSYDGRYKQCYEEESE